MKQKRIAFYISSYFDGIGVNTLRLATEFAENNYIVDLLIVGDTENKVKSENKNLKIIEFKKTSAYKTLFLLINYIRDFQPKAVISGGEAPNIVLLLAKMLSRKKFKAIVSIRTHLSTQYKYTYRFNQTVLKYLGKLLYRTADEIVAVSKGVASDISKLFYIKKEDIHVIYNPIYNEKILEQAKELPGHPWLRHKNLPVILGVGRLERQKNFPLLIKAFSILRQKTKAKLIIVGDGSERNKLEDLILELNLANDINITGFVLNPYKYMKNSDVFVLSSDWEGFGNVIVEAMACGTEVISTNCPSGPVEILEDGKYGKLVDTDSPKQLAETIVRTIKYRSDNAVNSIDRAKQFSTENIMSAYEKLLLK